MVMISWAISRADLYPSDFVHTSIVASTSQPYPPCHVSGIPNTSPMVTHGLLWSSGTLSNTGAEITPLSATYICFCSSLKGGTDAVIPGSPLQCVGRCEPVRWRAPTDCRSYVR